jgi:hypothetical protein
MSACPSIRRPHLYSYEGPFYIKLQLYILRNTLASLITTKHRDATTAVSLTLNVILHSFPSRNQNFQKCYVISINLPTCDKSELLNGRSEIGRCGILLIFCQHTKILLKIGRQ